MHFALKTLEPCPSFPCFLFWKRQGKPPKKQGFFTPTEPQDSLEKKGKTPPPPKKKKTRNSSQGTKQVISKNEERKDREKPSKGRDLLLASCCHPCLLVWTTGSPNDHFTVPLTHPRKGSTYLNSEPPNLGSAEGGHPDLFRFYPISPFSSDLFRFAPICFRECPDLFRFVLFSSDLFRFVFRTSQNKSGQPLSADPFCKSPISRGPSWWALACPWKGPFSKQKKRKGPSHIEVSILILGRPLNQRIAKGAGGKGPRQKTSKIVKKCQKVFRHFSTIFAQGKKRQKSRKSVKKFFDTFRQFSRRAKIFPAPFAIRWLKTTFDMTTLIFSSGGCPSDPFYPLKRVPSYPLLAENTSSEGATKDHLSSKPPQGEPPGTKNQSGR